MALEVMARAATPIPLDISFRVEPGEMLALVGPSGSGKTTILRSIAGLWRPENARVVVDDVVWVDTALRTELPTHRRRVGVLFQNYALFPHMSALGNVMAAMDAPDTAEAARLLDLVNLHGLGARRPNALSGGQQQRVALARALARRPHALLLDEPFSAVDRPTREKLQAEILALRAHLQMPVVLVTHDLGEAQLLADRMVVLEKGQAVASGTTAAVMSDPAAIRALGIREAAGVLSAVVVAHHADGISQLETSAGSLFLPFIDSAPDSRVQVRIMASDVILSRASPEGLSAQNILPGTISRIEPRDGPGDGPGVMVYITSGTDELLARITRRAATQMALSPGDQIHAILKSLSIARDQIGPGKIKGDLKP